MRAAALLIAIAVALPARADNDRPDPVQIVNSATSPVPTVAQGTTAISGTVTVANPQTQVSLPKGTAVGIDPAANTVQVSQPVTVTATSPLPVNGNVGVSGTVSVGNTVGVTGTVAVGNTVGVTGTVAVGNTVGVAGTVSVGNTVGVTGSVQVTNDASSPIPVQIAGAPASSDARFQGFTILIDPQDTSDPQINFTVPGGQRFYLDAINIMAIADQGQVNAFLSFVVLSPNPNPTILQGAVDCVLQPHSKVTVCNQPTHFFFDPGESFSLLINRTDHSGVCQVWYTVSGHFVATP